MEQNNIEANGGTGDGENKGDLSPRRYRRRRRNRRQNDRTVRWYHDSLVGTEDAVDLSLTRFFISIDKDETPEIFFIPMMRWPERDEDGRIVGYKPMYAGDIERNAIPLSTLDIGLHTKALVDMKARLSRMKAEHYAARDQVPPPEPALHRIVVPPETKRRIVVHPEATPQAEPLKKRRLADLL